jgi:D-alanyl-lipoteichoic acid acyltransferase DltB (MBOAT superfamily)
MLFNSLEFAIFLPIVFILYWFVLNKNLKHQNVLILIASYVFYGWWDWKFLSLIIFSSIIDYSIGLRLKEVENKNKRKVLLWTSIFVNIGLLGVFKYYNFFLDSLYDVIPGLKVVLGFNTLDIILPVGISFYTFQTLSYTIDVYKKKLEPTKDFIAFSAFVSFFPQLVAGPIERASNLLPQFFKRRVFKYEEAILGLRQILWGLFKKVVIADNCAIFANLVFENSSEASSLSLFVGALMFTFQIYGDFSGYSDIAIGTSRLFGFKLMKNFAFPYFSRDIAEFWRRWHISLSTWFRDYLYIPLGGSKNGKLISLRNIFIIFIVSGFWHGANWTFIFWGALNAIYFLPLFIFKKNRDNLSVIASNSSLPSLREIVNVIGTFMLTIVAWIFFRADSLSHAFRYIKIMFTSFDATIDFTLDNRIWIFLAILIIIEWLSRKSDFGLHNIDLLIKSRIARWLVYFALIILILFYSGRQQDFIYFQF